MPSDNKPKIFSGTFEIKGKNIPQMLFGEFTNMQAKLFGLRGYVEQTADGIKGYVEGEEKFMKKMKSLLTTAEKFKKSIETAVFSEIKEIQKFTKDSFEFKRS